MTVPFLHQPGDEITLLELNACCAFGSKTSISFDLRRRSPECLQQIGWLDVHYPCEDHVKARLRIWLPDEYERFDKMTQLVDEVFSALTIPTDTIYELSLHSGGRQIRFTNRTDYI